jgi:hypothetical protein
MVLERLMWLYSLRISSIDITLSSAFTSIWSSRTANATLATATLDTGGAKSNFVEGNAFLIAVNIDIEKRYSKGLSMVIDALRRNFKQ